MCQTQTIPDHEPDPRAGLSIEQLLAVVAQCYWTIHDDAMSAFRLSLQEKQVRTVQTSGEDLSKNAYMPPQHGKSELVSRRFPAYMLGRSPNLRLIAAPHTQELAVTLNRDIQCHLPGEGPDQAARTSTNRRRRIQEQIVRCFL